MIKLASGMLLALVFVMASVCATLSDRLFIRLGFSRKANQGLRILCEAISVLWILFGALFGPEIPILFIGYLFITGLHLLLYGWQGIRSIKILMMGFIQFASPALIVLGCFSLFENDIYGLTENLIVRCIVLILSTLTVSLFCRFPWERFSFQGIGADSDEKNTAVFLGVLGCCCVYVFFDGFLCELHPEGIVVPVLLISGNLLVFLMILLFFWNSFQLAKNQFLESEHGRIEAEKAEEKLKRERINELNNRDGLTGAYSRRYAMERINSLLKEGKNFTIIYIDLDGLKKVNDRLGHLEGDHYLRNFTERMKRMLAGQGCLARIGGDEFLVLLPDMGMEEAEPFMERIRTEMGSESEEGRISFSFGAASGASCAEVLIREADRAMYLDKNRIRKGGEE